MREDMTLSRALFHVALVVALVVLVGACGGPPRVAQQALSATAEGVARADVIVADRAAQADEVARAAALEIDGFEQALAAYDLAMAPWVTAERALLEAKGALLALQTAHDAWVAGAGDGGWLEAVACAVPILLRVSEAMLRAGVDVPPKLTTALSILVRLAERQCPEPEVTR